MAVEKQVGESRVGKDMATPPTSFHISKYIYRYQKDHVFFTSTFLSTTQNEFGDRLERLGMGCGEVGRAKKASHVGRGGLGKPRDESLSAHHGSLVPRLLTPLTLPQLFCRAVSRLVMCFYSPGSKIISMF